jgi:hypothetical protein
MAGYYQVAVLDSMTCVVNYPQNPVVVTEPEPISITGVATTPVTGFGLSDGTITVEASGGTPPLLYSLSQVAPWQQENYFTDLSAGSYLVMVKDSNDCEVPYSLNPVVVLEPSVGLEKPSPAGLLNIHPNPFSESVSFTFSLMTEMEVLIEFYDIYGQTLFPPVQHTFSAGHHSIPFDTKLWTSGIWFFRIQMGNDVQTGKLVKL